jgi:hypothetical protein
MLLSLSCFTKSLGNAIFSNNKSLFKRKSATVSMQIKILKIDQLKQEVMLGYIFFVTDITVLIISLDF